MTARRFQLQGNPVRVLGLAFLAAGLALASPGPATADTTAPAKLTPPRVFDKDVPENRQDLLAIQNHVKRILPQLLASTVAVRIGASQGSGVIINKEGQVLTAGHVSGDAGQAVEVVLPNGRKVKGKTLGANHNKDSGMVQITDKGPWPHVDMGQSATLKKGQWCLAIGHPGGYRTGRPPVVRLGRLLEHGTVFLRTDCTLVGGDSGGPLFDMYGRVIGIHSRIGGPITTNVHVAVDTYRATWARLAKGDVWGSAYIGVELDTDAKSCKIRQVTAGSPADVAGLKANDVLTMFDGKKVSSIDELSTLLRQKGPGSQVSLQVQRGTQVLSVKLVLGRRQMG